MQIIPSIISSNFSEIKDRIKKVEGLVDWVEIDVVDGLFASNYTWPVCAGGQAPEDLKQIEGKIKISAHLMVESPEILVENWHDFVDRIVVHYESTSNLEKIIELVDPHVGLAIALELNTPIEKILEYLGRVKTVQLMSIGKIGYTGEKFDERVFEKIKVLKTNWPDIKIIVDGGIDLEIAKKLKELGVSGVVVGSRIWQAENIEEIIGSFKKL